MDKLMNTFETCEDCYNRICVLDIVVKDTPDGICIYCQKCTERHKFLDLYAVNGESMLRNLKEKQKKKKNNI